MITLLLEIGLRYRSTFEGEADVGISERHREINRRRHRRKKLNRYKKKLEKATVSERHEIAAKIRALTPGAEVVVSNMGLDER